VAQIDEEKFVPGCQMSIRANLLGSGGEKSHIDKLEAAFTDREGDHRLALKLAETTQVFVGVEENEFFEGKLSVSQNRLDLPPF
jgi:hypothetical protein